MRTQDSSDSEQAKQLGYLILFFYVSMCLILFFILIASNVFTLRIV